jgi:hypothetical protein
VNTEQKNLKKAYVAELRESKQMAEQWWRELHEKHAQNSGSVEPKELWPMGAPSHPWVIATFRKYYFLCAELNGKIQADLEQRPPVRATPDELHWGQDQEEESREGPIDPLVFAIDLLSGKETQDVYEFLQRLVYIPIGIKNGEDV